MTASVPVLLMGFNRPELLARVIDRLREVRPTQVFMAVDGPRPDRAGEAERVQACRDLAGSIDWPCEVRTLFQERNLGCGLGVSTAITWFFEQVERGIILEDDIVPDVSFFGFCGELLERYEHDERVFAVSGANLVPPSGLTRPSDPYRFTQIPHIWGWATWRRSWQQHRLDIADWRTRLPVRRLWSRSGHSLPGAVFWGSTFEVLGRKEVDTWDGQLVLAAMASGQLTAISNVCLTENIGFGGDATHTVEQVDDLLPVRPVALPTRPVEVRLDAKADAWTRRHHFGATVPGVVRLAVKYVQQRRGRT
jgi:hypothetical protein